MSLYTARLNSDEWLIAFPGPLTRFLPYSWEYDPRIRGAKEFSETRKRHPCCAVCCSDIEYPRLTEISGTCGSKKNFFFGKSLDSVCKKKFYAAVASTAAIGVES